MARVQFAAIVLGLVAIALALGGSSLGWLGGVIACGADRAPGCATWPPPVSEAVWAAFIIGVGVLVVWQTRT